MNRILFQIELTTIFRYKTFDDFVARTDSESGDPHSMHFQKRVDILDTAGGRLVYSNAGHPYPVLLRKNGEFIPMKKGGPVIGVIDPRSSGKEKGLYGEEQLKMYPGDKLFVYTDGIVEYQNQNRELYGNERFYSQLIELNNESISDTVEIVLKSLMDFGNQTKPQDDISLLGFEIK